MADPATQVPTGLTTKGLVGRRYTAFFIDWMLLATATAIILWIERLAAPSMMRSAYGAILELLLYLILWIGYGVILESSAAQATIGKQWMGLRVYDTEARRIAPMQAATRNIVKDGPFLLLQYVPKGIIISWVLLGAHAVALHRSRVYRAIHDRIAGTWVAVPAEAPEIDLGE